MKDKQDWREVDLKMANNFKGVIIEESLEKKDILKKLKILKTEVEKVTEKHQTPYLKQWTLHTIEIPEENAEEIAEEIGKSLDSVHDDWYADFKNEKYHFIIFLNKVFKVDRSSKEQYDEVKKYGISIGIPDYQLDF